MRLHPIVRRVRAVHAKDFLAPSGKIQNSTAFDLSIPQNTSALNRRLGVAYPPELPKANGCEDDVNHY
jgi:hypothetical protein